MPPFSFTITKSGKEKVLSLKLHYILNLSLSQLRNFRNRPSEPSPVEGRAERREDFVLVTRPLDGLQVESDDLESRPVIHVEQNIAERVDDKAVAAVREILSAIASVDADDEELILQSPGCQERSPEMDVGRSPGAGNKKDLSPPQCKCPNLFGELGVKADEDARPKTGKIEEAQRLSGDEGVLLFQFGMKVDLVVGKKQFSPRADDVTAVAVALSRPDGKAAGDDGNLPLPCQLLQSGEDRFSLFKKGEAVIERNDGVPEFRQDQHVTVTARGRFQEGQNILNIPLGVGSLQGELEKADTKMSHETTPFRHVPSRGPMVFLRGIAAASVFA